jgi:hypothetical protein
MYSDLANELRGQIARGAEYPGIGLEVAAYRADAWLRGELYDFSPHGEPGAGDEDF